MAHLSRCFLFWGSKSDITLNAQKIKSHSNPLTLRFKSKKNRALRSWILNKRNTSGCVFLQACAHLCLLRRISTMMWQWWKQQPLDNSGTIPGCSSVVWEQALANGSVPLFPVCIFSCCLTASDWLGAGLRESRAWIMQSCQSKLSSVAAATLKLRMERVGDCDGGSGYYIFRDMCT